MLDAHYGHLVPDSEGYLRRMLDQYDEKDRAAVVMAKHEA